MVGTNLKSWPGTLLRLKLEGLRNSDVLAGSLEVTGSAKNYFGHAENVELTLDGFKERYEVRDLNLGGLPGGMNLDLKLTVPRVAATEADLEVGLHHKEHNLEKWSSYMEQRSGFSVASVW
jgi:hypothetical protein